MMLASPSIAQVATVRPKHGGGNHHPQKVNTLSVVAPRNQSFWLFVDDVLQNEAPVRSICIRNLWNDNFYIRVELNNERQNCIGEMVNLNRSKSFAIVQNGKYFGLDHTQAPVRPELTINLVERLEDNGNNTFAHLGPGLRQNDYEEACRLISRETFDSSRLNIAKQVVSANPMTANQIIGICKLLSFENHKLEFAKFAYAYCTEPNRYYLLNEVFSYDSSKRDLDEYIRGF